MKRDETDPHATRSASPSAAEPGPGAAPANSDAHEPRATTQQRDPERYRVIGEHGRGGLGRVSRAHDRDLGRDVAIKELISRGTIGEVRFMREALITARLEHPGIVPVHEAGRWPDGTPFYAMKLVAGRPLRDLIAERTTVQDRIALLHHVIAVADAIAYAHGRNIIHRDLKPANVIVGDFGETIVIDWGLAKDLSTDEESTVGGGPFRANRDDGLTATGSVLGTPAYMAPEQERGEPVDQRADVYAIGAMLCELCVLADLPATPPRARHRMLRRAGIDQDLIAIIDKALDPAPERRYADAGALAADLKSFKSGARIAARDYSLFAVLAHWTRRHRALALAATAVVALLAAGSILYVRTIAIERDRADAALARAESAGGATRIAQRAAEAALGEQILKRAELVLATDPSAALDLLATYRGDDAFQLALLRAQARGRGLAQVRAAPHTDMIFWTRGLANHAVVTVSADGTIAITDAAGKIRVIAHGVINKNAVAYSERRQLLAYACQHDNICLIDTSSPDPVIIAEFSQARPDGLAFSADGMALAAASHDGVAIAWDVSTPRQPRELARKPAVGLYVGFLDDHTLGVVGTDSATIVPLAGTPRPLAVHDAAAIDVSHARHLLAIATKAGFASLVDPSSRQLGHPTRLCDGPLNVLRFLPDPYLIGYGCQNGNVGIWDTRAFRIKALAIVRGSVDCLEVTADGRYLAIGGSAGTLSILDLESSILASYLGHDVQLSFLATPDARFPYFISGDMNGRIRVWPRPASVARVAYTSTARIFDTQVLADSASTISLATETTVHFETPEGGRDEGPHDALALFARTSSDGDHFVTYGQGGAIEWWSARERRRLALIPTQQPSTQWLRFVSEHEVVFSGSDGRVLRWSPTGGLSTITTFTQPVDIFHVLPGAQRLVAQLSDGTLWIVGLDGSTAPVPTQREKSLAASALSPDGRWLATADNEGAVAIYDTQRWQTATVLHTTGAIRHIVFSPRNDLVAIATKTGLVHLGALPAAADADWVTRPIAWRQFSSSARYLAFSGDGEILMVACSDGVIWFHAPRTQRWSYFASGTADLTVLRPALDGRHVVSADSAGRLMVLDLAAVRRLLDADLDKPPP